MGDSKPRRRARSISPVVGVVLMVIVVVVLAGLVVAFTTSLATTTKESAAPHGFGRFDIELHESAGDVMHISPDALAADTTTYQLQINQNVVHEWDGHGRLRITCLYPGDEIIIRSKKGSTTYTVQTHTINRTQRCTRISDVAKKFRYAFVNGKRVQVRPKYEFSIQIDPDGPGNDDTFGYPTFDDDIGTIPVTNQWHYIKRYNHQIEGLGPPVFVIVMTDNAHWKAGVAAPYGNYNWTDGTAADGTPLTLPGDPGKNAFKIVNEQLITVTTGTEPTNDIYMLFAPGCDESKLKIVEVNAAYQNDIYINGNLEVDDTSAISGSKLFPSLPGVKCVGR